MRPIVQMILVSLLVVILSSMAYAQRPKYEIESLLGLKGVYVLIEGLGSDIEADGLREDNIQTDVELKLRLAGIKVLTKEECYKEPGSPFLYVCVTDVTSSSISTYAVSVNIKLTQEVLIVRDRKTLVRATTWDDVYVLLVGKQTVATYVRDNIKDRVDEFVNDYLSVNPKE